MANDAEIAIVIEKDWNKLKSFIRKVDKDVKPQMKDYAVCETEDAAYIIFRDCSNYQITNELLYKTEKRADHEYDTGDLRKLKKVPLDEAPSTYNAIKYQLTHWTEIGETSQDYNIEINWRVIDEKTPIRLRSDSVIEEHEHCIVVRGFAAWGFPEGIENFLNSLDVSWQGAVAEPGMEVYSEEIGTADFGLRVRYQSECEVCGEIIEDGMDSMEDLDMDKECDLCRCTDKLCSGYVTQDEMVFQEYVGAQL